jgi:hypothetical protein
MKDKIKAIIRKIPKGSIFDTHTIIEYMLQKYSNTYIKNPNGNSTELHHAKISRIILSIAKEVNVKKFEDKSWSLNIRDKFSKCACWQKK